MGRPKGSKNKPKINEEKEKAEVYQHTTEDFTMQKKIIKGQKIPAKAGKNMWKDDGSIPEEEFDKLLIRVKMVDPFQQNLVLMGGCALNCSANPIARKYFNEW
jgi:predicted NodU family carbamoyl transferase